MKLFKAGVIGVFLVRSSIDKSITGAIILFFSTCIPPVLNLECSDKKEKSVASCLNVDDFPKLIFISGYIKPFYTWCSLKFVGANLDVGLIELLFYFISNGS